MHEQKNKYNEEGHKAIPRAKIIEKEHWKMIILLTHGGDGFFAGNYEIA